MAAVAIIAAGSVISSYGQIRAASEQAKAAERGASLRDLQAKEEMERARINSEALFKQSDRMIASQSTASAASGFASSPLLIMEDTYRQAQDEHELLQREASFRADQIRAEASDLRDQARSIRRAAVIGAAGSLLSAGGQTYLQSKGRSGA